MRQILQEIRNGSLSVAELPSPLAMPGEVVVANRASVISAGTEKAVIELASKSLLGKARERPDQVRRVLQKVRQEGLLSTVRQVREKLADSMPLGYSSAGVVVACGDGVTGFRPGDRVASNGAHAEIVAAPANLCALVPEAVAFDHAAFAVLGSIALQGVRLSRVQLGETVYVIGLGLIGQIAVMLAKAAGARVFATDLDPRRCELAAHLGADRAGIEVGGETVAGATAGHGADAVIVTASSASSSPVLAAIEAVRRRGRVVVVGAVGLDLDRRPLYFKEAEIVVSCSYGPGRYDADYEDRGHDYPYGFVRWTEQRNIQAVLDLMAAGQLDVGPLISHRFPVERALEGYEIVRTGADPHLGIVLEYDAEPASLDFEPRPLTVAPAAEGKARLGILGAGNFARATMLPILAAQSQIELAAICSAGGVSAKTAAQRFGIGAVSTNDAAVLGSNDLDAVAVLTRHHLHAPQVVEAIRAGKHVFVEKPLALTLEELGGIVEAVEDHEEPPLLMVGFNRRFSPAVGLVRDHFKGHAGPLTVVYRFNAGAIPADSWIHEPTEGGGRLIGEACHAIDTVTAITGSVPCRVFAESIGGPHAPRVTSDQTMITIRHANGSVSSIAYLAGGDRSMPKERVEVLGGGRMAVIDDYRSVELAEGGKVRRQSCQGKGHREEIAAFAAAICDGGAWPIPLEELIAVSKAAILTEQSLRDGLPLPA